MPELKPVAWMWEYRGFAMVTASDWQAAMLQKDPDNKVTPLYAIPDAAPLTDQIRTLAAHMIKVAAAMEYYSGFNSEIRDKSLELLGASHIAEKWADAIERCDDVENGGRAQQTVEP